MSIDHETLMAYADGELDETARLSVERAILADPDLARKLDTAITLRENLRQHFAPLMAAPVPDQWTAMIRDIAEEKPVADAGTVVNMDAVRAMRGRGIYWGAGLAIAASLAIGVLVGTQMAGQGRLTEQNGALIASASLAHALDTQLAANQEPTGLRMLVSFQTEAGQYCRAFTDASLSGIACKAGDVWKIDRVLAGSAAWQSEYRQAGSVEMELMAAAQNMADGDPLDAQGETDARSKGWR